MRMYVPLKKAEFERLLDLAHRERRRPQDQAAVLICQALDAIFGPLPPPEPVPTDDD